MSRAAESVSAITPRTRTGWVLGIVGVLIGIALGGSVAWQVAMRQSGLRAGGLGAPSDALSTRELALMLGLHHWRYTIPQNGQSQRLMFELRNGDVVTTSGAVSGAMPGETITVAVRPLLESGKLECSMKGKDFHGRHILDNPFAHLNVVHFTPDGWSVNGKPLIQGQRDGKDILLPANENNVGDVSLWVVVKDRT